MKKTPKRFPTAPLAEVLKRLSRRRWRAAEKVRHKHEPYAVTVQAPERAQS